MFREGIKKKEQKSILSFQEEGATQYMCLYPTGQNLLTWFHTALKEVVSFSLYCECPPAQLKVTEEKEEEQWLRSSSLCHPS